MTDEITSEDVVQSEGLDEPEVEDPTAVLQLMTDLEARCKAAGIRCEQSEDPILDRMVTIYMPSGRDTTPIMLFEPRLVKDLLAIPFERYVVFGSYVAICSYQDSVIEAGLSPLATPGQNLPIVMQSLAGVPPEQRGLRKPIPTITLQSPNGTGRVLLGPSSQALDVLGLGAGRQRPSLRIEGIRVEQYADALELLEKVSNAVLFQLEVARNTAVGLIRRRRGPRRLLSRKGTANPIQLEFPSSEYDRDPISLYWYARSATGMPLLQFLAYYQAIEFYFPTYSEAEARRKVRNVLKSPAFRADRDADLARILLAAKSSGSGFGDERAQLRATLNECLEPGALRDWFGESPGRAEYFSKKTEGLTSQRIGVASPNADLRNDVADRVYDIRCKIVHTKSGGRDGEVELLLPYSKEAELLYSDIDLIQFCVREVLISASTASRL